MRESWLLQGWTRRRENEIAPAMGWEEQQNAETEQALMEGLWLDFAICKHEDHFEIGCWNQLELGWSQVL